MSRAKNWQVEWVSVDGRKVRVIAAPPPSVQGNNPLHLPVLFLHGLGCSAEVWEPTIDEMARRNLCCPVVAPDMPGYGVTPGPRHAMDMAELADWAVRFLDARGLDRVHIAGNSMGCQVALELASRHPERVAGMVLQGPTTGDRLVPPWRYAVGLAGDAFQESLSYNLRLMKMYTQMGPRRYLSTVKKMLDDDPLANVSKVTAPTLVIRGGHDVIVSDGIARRLAAALPDAVYTPLDSAAHAIEWNFPQAFTDAMLTFLTRAEEKLGIEEACPAPTTPPGESAQSTGTSSTQCLA
jgi:2-hydroxy-6-oxonona-2,4-dienedioate hydrolase